jgi:hypothetical protein
MLAGARDVCVISRDCRLPFASGSAEIKPLSGTLLK